MTLAEKYLDVAPVVNPRDFEAYQASMNGYRDESPQQQGIETFAGYQAALRDPRTITASLDGATVPQLFPIEYNGWLNPDYISTKFDVPADSILVLHATEKMKSAQIEAARENIARHLTLGGVVVIDYPSTDSRYLNRAQQFLSEHAPDVQLTYQETGTQTYFAGVAKPNNPEQWRAAQQKVVTIEPVSRLMEVFNRKDDPFISRDVWADSKGLVLEAHRKMPVGLAISTYEFVRAAFEKIKDHPCRQGWSPEEFLEIATSTDTVTKLTASKGHENGSAVMAFGSRLEDYPWVNPQFYNRRYAAEIAEGNLVYFPTVAANPNSKGLRGMFSLVRPIAEGFASMGEVVVCFDSCDRNRDFLGKMIADATAATGISTLQFDQIAQQRYGIFKAA